MKKPIVALLTDYGTRDTYVSEVKAVILSYRWDTVIVDITHEIEAFNTVEGAFMLMLAAKTFPKNTIFLAVVDPGVGGKREAVVVKTKKGRFFIGPDTGLLYPAVKREGVSKIYRINIKAFENVSATFHGRDVFARIVGLMVSGKNWTKYVKEVSDMVRLEIPNPKWFNESVEATVLHVDQFGNIILNISRPFPQEWKKVNVAFNEKIVTDVKVGGYYSEVEEDGILLLVGGTGYYELAVNQGNAAKMLPVKAGDKILISKSLF